MTLVRKEEGWRAGQGVERFLAMLSAWNGWTSQAAIMQKNGFVVYIGLEI
jgi:hypothetical protein